jgi:hypothetical protein
MKKKRRLTRGGLTYHVNINRVHDVLGRDVSSSLELDGGFLPDGTLLHRIVGEHTSQWSVHP